MFKFGENSALELTISHSENIIKLHSKTYKQEFPLVESKKSKELNRSLYNKANVILSEIKKHVKSGKSVDLYLASDRPITEQELQNWLLNLWYRYDPWEAIWAPSKQNRIAEV